MAKQNQVQSRTYEAGADLSGDQFLIMAQSGGQIVRQTAPAAQSAGVLQNNPSAQGEAAEVAYAGQVKIVAGAAVLVDALVASDALGRAVTAVATDVAVGTARNAAGAAGELLEVDLFSVQPIV